MAAISVEGAVTSSEAPLDRPARGLLHDTWILAKRGIIHMKRQPEQLSDATIQPVMFVLLFAYVFGGAIPIKGGGNYREFLMGGIIAQTLTFGTFGAAMAIANDQKNQAVDRFRSLPIARGALMGGYALSNLIKSALPILIMSLTGLVVGWRIRGSFLDALMAYLMMLAFSLAMIWIGILLGALVGSPEGVTGIAFAVIFPVTFIASTFVPVDSMPEVLRPAAQWNPVTTLSDALRDLFNNPSPPISPGAPWPTHHPVLYTWIWIIGIIVVVAPLAIRVHTKRNAA